MLPLFINSDLLQTMLQKILSLPKLFSIQKLELLLMRKNPLQKNLLH